MNDETLTLNPNAVNDLFDATPLNLNDFQKAEVMELLTFNTDADLRKQLQTYQAALDLRANWETLSQDEKTALFEKLT